MTDGRDQRPASALPEVRAGSEPEPSAAARPSQALRHEQIALVDLLDRVLAGGVAVLGDVRLAIADVDLVTISVRALISSVTTVMGEQPAPGAEAVPGAEETPGAGAAAGEDAAGGESVRGHKAVRGEVLPGGETRPAAETMPGGETRPGGDTRPGTEAAGGDRDDDR